MPNSEFLEKWPLYRKYPMELPQELGKLAKPPIHMECSICGSPQTLNMLNEYYIGGRESRQQPPHGLVICVEYLCEACREFSRFFLLWFDPNGAFVEKVGQYPSWDISIEPSLRKMLSQHAETYKNGLICESQGYGIGAFAYYRRIVEEIIGSLLELIPELMSGNEKERYLTALEKVKQTTVTEEKIRLVKDLLPPVLRPDGLNPLSTLHEVLSEGLHDKPDEECLSLAAQIREVLLFLVNQVTASKEAKKNFTESMRKLLERQKK